MVPVIIVFPLKLSRPMRARGLKHQKPVKKSVLIQVAPHAGAWIETWM